MLEPHWLSHRVSARPTFEQPQTTQKNLKKAMHPQKTSMKAENEPPEAILEIIILSISSAMIFLIFEFQPLNFGVCNSLDASRVWYPHCRF